MEEPLATRLEHESIEKFQRLCLRGTLRGNSFRHFKRGGFKRGGYRAALPVVSQPVDYLFWRAFTLLRGALYRVLLLGLTIGGGPFVHRPRPYAPLARQTDLPSQGIGFPVLKLPERNKSVFSAACAILLANNGLNELVHSGYIFC